MLFAVPPNTSRATVSGEGDIEQASIGQYQSSTVRGNGEKMFLNEKIDGHDIGIDTTIRNYQGGSSTLKPFTDLIKLSVIVSKNHHQMGKNLTNWLKELEFSVERAGFSPMLMETEDLKRFQDLEKILHFDFESFVDLNNVTTGMNTYTMTDMVIHDREGSGKINKSPKTLKSEVLNRLKDVNMVKFKSFLTERLDDPETTVVNIEHMLAEIYIGCYGNVHLVDIVYRLLPCEVSRMVHGHTVYSTLMDDLRRYVDSRSLLETCDFFDYFYQAIHQTQNVCTIAGNITDAINKIQYRKEKLADVEKADSRRLPKDARSLPIKSHAYVMVQEVRHLVPFTIYNLKGFSLDKLSHLGEEEVFDFPEFKDLADQLIGILERERMKPTKQSELNNATVKLKGQSKKNANQNSYVAFKDLKTRGKKSRIKRKLKARRKLSNEEKKFWEESMDKWEPSDKGRNYT